MKKLSLFLAVLCILSLAAIPAFASGEQTMKAYNGTAVVDGKIDDAWANVPGTALTANNTDAGDDSATIKVMWDADKIYLLCVAKDSTIFLTDGTNSDRIQFFFDPTNTYPSSLNDNDHARGALCLNGDRLDRLALAAHPEYVEYKAEQTADGCVIEASFDLKALNVKMEAGTKLGFEIKYDNFRDGGKTIFYWNDAEDNAWQTADVYGTLEFAADKAVAETTTAAAATTTTAAAATTTTTAAQTSDSIVLVAMAGVIALAAAAVVCKKSRV